MSQATPTIAGTIDQYADEQWLPVVGYEGAYEVSDQGRARSIDRISACGRRYRGVLLKPATDRRGYQHVELSANGKPTSKKIHRLVLEAFVGPCPAGMECLHGPNGVSDNSVGNLSWGTHHANLLQILEDGNHELVNRTHCPRGHEHSALNNVGVSARNGHRYCLACSRATSWARAWRVRGWEISEEQVQAKADEHFAAILAGEKVPPKKKVGTSTNPRAVAKRERRRVLREQGLPAR